MKDKTLALAGVFQSSELVRQAACHGTWSGYAATACLDSLFRLEADSLDEIYGDRQRMRLGLETLQAVLQGENDYADTLRYSVGLLQLQRKFNRSGRVQDEVGNALQEIARQDEELEQHEREDRQAHDVASLYARTLSLISPRIMVSGNPQYLQNERVTDWIRTLLMAGIRSATLWQQLGGGRLELMFSRKRILKDVQEFLVS
ncbi:MAG: high frequency lysogenization protein HflD [Xanthomonadales bacterium]|nr:high frequency lysogenization protein HflD [Gammaproteobacteria bacterium]MBT8056017.1 high frequency lysogenization protein HflD [Gammaproteobacteria bacterium]NNJ79501.1 high frequency lysogenization protein HflD [Xanthomonadales bacterium]NNL05639.1 high frequency lysogenization protein HflD [Xanthomonadales bacterium]